LSRERGEGNVVNDTGRVVPEKEAVAFIISYSFNLRRSMDLTPEPPPPSAQKPDPSPFPPHKPPDPVFPPNFSWDDTAFRPEPFLDSFEADYGGRQLELRNKIVENLRGPLTFQHQCQFESWNQRVARGITPIHF